MTDSAEYEHGVSAVTLAGLLVFDVQHCEAQVKRAWQ